MIESPVRLRNVSRQLEILLVDDDDVDVMMTRRVLEQAGVDCSLTVARDGVEALQILNKEAPHDSAPRPDLILLDLNMPRMDGHEVLRMLKANGQYTNIPAIILTTSDAERDIAVCYENRANGYVTKPVDAKQFQKAVRTIIDYWFEVVQLPSA